MNDRLVWVTGVTSGLGKAFATALLQAGFRVVGTVRTPEAVKHFEAIHPGRAFGRVLDITREDAMAPMAESLERELGPIYALINNAGYGHEGTLEESPMEELRHQFEVNVFGSVAMMKAVLPCMRQRRSGRILNVTSMGGLMTMPGLSFYHGSKFALEGISNSLGKEVKEFGILVTAVEPGMFRTDWAGRSMVRSSRSIPDYDSVFEPIRQARLARNGKQPGDPAKAGTAIVELLQSPNPPARLLLGPDGFQYVWKELDEFRAESQAWKWLTDSTNFDADKGRS